MTDVEDKSVALTPSDAADEVADEAVAAAAEAKESASASLDDALSSAKEALATVKSWGKSASNAMGEAWATLGTWKEEGTPLRGAFKSARLSLNDVNVKLHEHTIFGPAKRREWYEEIMDKQKAEMEKLDRNGIGKRAFIRNGAVAFTLSAGWLYGGEWFKRRMVKRAKEGRDDYQLPRP